MERGYCFANFGVQCSLIKRKDIFGGGWHKPTWQRVPQPQIWLSNSQMRYKHTMVNPCVGFSIFSSFPPTSNESGNVRDRCQHRLWYQILIFLLGYTISPTSPIMRRDPPCPKIWNVSWILTRSSGPGMEPIIDICSPPEALRCPTSI